METVKKVGRPKGQPKTGGRKKGSVGTLNNSTSMMRDQVLQALVELGGHKYLVSVAKENPSAFLSYAGRFAPKEIKLETDSVINVIINKP